LHFDRPKDMIKKRSAVHFPGFEPLDAEAHRKRYMRSAVQTAQAYGFSLSVGPLQSDAAQPHFDIEASGAEWRTETRMMILDHIALIQSLLTPPLLSRLLSGYRAAFQVLANGAFLRYARQAWRFALFFAFPFLFVGLGLAAAVALARLPLHAGLPAWHLIWSAPLALAAFFKVFLPYAERFHTQLLFADWQLAVALAKMDDPDCLARLEQAADALTAAIETECDERLVTAHSMGGALALHALGIVLERDPHAFDGRPVTLVTLGGQGLQVSMMRSATVLRRRIGLVLDCPHITWIDIQCVSDAANFYVDGVAALSGHPGKREPAIQRIRMKRMLTPAHYKRIKRDLLRMHRQFVLGSDVVSRFDFQVMTAGPHPAAAFAAFTESEPPRV
jgi:hypothetical protein